MTQIKPGFLCTGDAHDTVQVGLIVSAETADGVHSVNKIADVWIKYAGIFRIGDHQTRSPL